LVIAALVHVAVFVFSPQFRSDLSDVFGRRASVTAGDGSEVRWLDVDFGPPRIMIRGGLERQEPPDRVLRARDVVVSAKALSAECRWVVREELEEARATVRLEVAWDGRVRHAEIADGSGDECVDQMIVVVAGTLWYHWLPDVDAPAPVELVQPMRLRGAM
jgi:hypothetical protein